MTATLRSIAAACVFLAGMWLMIEGQALWERATGQPRGDELLAMAAALGDASLAERALRQGASVDVLSPMGHTPLALAAGGGDQRLVSILLAAGADVNVRDPAGYTALSYAAAIKCDPATIRVLLEAGADPDGTPDLPDMCPPLVSASMKGSAGAAETLLAYGADANLRGTGDNRLTPLTAARRNGHDDVASVLRRHGATH